MASHPLTVQPSAQQIGDAYLREAVLNASKAELALMSFNGILRFLQKAQQITAERPASYEETVFLVAQFHDSITRAQAIVSDLNGVLNMEEGGQIAIDLRDQYLYLNHYLGLAASKKDGQMIGRAIRIIENLRDGWVAAMDKLREEAHEGRN